MAERMYLHCVLHVCMPFCAPSRADPPAPRVGHQLMRVPFYWPPADASSSADHQLMCGPNRSCRELRVLILSWCKGVGDEGVQAVAQGCPLSV